ncbi:hypothetical protein BDN70DRAFT_816806 [Pholiota conissans]|uniref:Uncharacterized protein n=1 Tax=Pholiota conissans TaxID=109636 RepID=A0A9P5YQT1_9AGAR|nr:hypothetical protein BDN70DRAFT_816806 [Pholiota conissans]
MFKLYAPCLHGFYSNTINGLHNSNNSLVPPIAGSVFAACMINFGPQPVTTLHHNIGNLPWGWCTVTALGDFDYKFGGHIISWDINCYAKFPSGLTTTLPSAILHHSNTLIVLHKTQYSVAQYSARSLFYWVDSGFQSKESWNENATPEDHRQHAKEQRKQWARGIFMLSTLDKLL